VNPDDVLSPRGGVPRTVDLRGVQELLERGAQLVEVLPREEYDELHLPGAISIPLKELDAERAERLDRARPVVVYCWDALCDMSPRAAAWLAHVGFEAHDYALSKVGWMAHGLPMEGTAAAAPTALSFVHDDVATCTLDDRAGEVRRRIESSRYGFALVLTDRVVLGRVRRSGVEQAPEDASVELLMEPGPSTTRPHTSAEELADRLDRADATTGIVTTPEGELIGVVSRADLPARAS
jgi:rhodanese-related sulfurtransferase